MPNYDYKCTNCGHQEEVFQKMTDGPLMECPQCHQLSFKRGPGGGIGLQFHGSGFYITDYDGKKPPASDNGCGCGKSACKA